MNGQNAGAPSWLKWVAVVGLLGFMVAFRVVNGDRAPVENAQPPAAPPPAPPAPGKPGAPGGPGGPGGPGAPGQPGAPKGKPEADVTELKKTDLKVGTGKEAKPGSSVTVNYRGTLTNGTMFDQSYGREPFNFTLGQGVIEGWSQGVAGMKEGGKRKLVIPPDLGYGAQGAGGDIPPNATLVFEIELIKVN